MPGELKSTDKKAFEPLLLSLIFHNISLLQTIQRLGELELLSMFSMSCIIQRLGELELSLQHHQDMNNTLEDQLHKTRHLDAEHQDRMENTQRELNELKRKLKEAENRAQVCSNEISPNL
jgi:septal ring factor EnvC (AmiA/AmiB activator)